MNGINEADRDNWKRSVQKISRTLALHNRVALVLSCWTPDDRQIFSERSRNKFVMYRHPGFEETEFDAQGEFFRYYGVPRPSVPLLADEFSKPLFLKILCGMLSGFTAKTKCKKIRDIASGHKSMTKIFEVFIQKVGKGIEGKYLLPRKTCWRILKGKETGPKSEITGVAP